MIVSVRKKDIYWSYAGQLTELGTYAILTPIVTIFLKPFEVGLWYTFMSFYFFALLIDSGFSPMIMRNAAFCMAGATELTKKGLPQTVKNSNPNYALLKCLFIVNRRLLTGVASGIFLLLLAGGLPYIAYITRSNFHLTYLIAWIVFALAISLNLNLFSFLAFLKGFGAIAEAQQAITIGRSLQFLACICGVLLNKGILSLAVGYLIGAFTIGIIIWIRFHRIVSPLLPLNSTISQKDVLIAIWCNSWRLILVGLGGYLITQANTLLCSAFLGLEITAGYGLTIQGFQAVGILASVLLQTLLPAISRARTENNLNSQIELLSISIVFFWIVEIIGSLAVLFFANPVLHKLGSSTFVLEPPIGLVLGIIYLLERNHYLFYNFITTSNNVPFLKASFISGIIICIVTIATVVGLRLGLWGLVLPQALIQLAYNNWKWPVYVNRELGCNFWSMLKTGVKVIGKKLNF